MRHVSAESIYNEIVLLSAAERDKLYNQLRKNFYHNFDILAYTTDGEALTREQYKRQVNIGIEQCIKGESISLEDLSKELGYNYAACANAIGCIPYGMQDIDKHVFLLPSDTFLRNVIQQMEMLNLLYTNRYDSRVPYYTLYDSML